MTLLCGEPSSPPHCNTENSKQIFPEKEFRGLSPNFHIHESVSDLHIPMIGSAGHYNIHRGIIHREMNRVLPEAECLDEIQTKVFKIFILSIHRHPCSFALRYIFLQTHATSYSF